MTKLATGIVSRVYNSISDEDWDVLQDYYNKSKEWLCELENLDEPYPLLTTQTRCLLELRRQTKMKEGNGSDKQDQV